MPVDKPSSGASATHNRVVSLKGNALSTTAEGPIRRSLSKSALFGHEDVIEVNILKSPAHKKCIRAPHQTGVQIGVHEGAPSPQQTRQVTIVDALLGRDLVFNINQSHTVQYLKSRIQSRQGQEGLRIIPAHIQLLTCNGRECYDLDQVWTVIQNSYLEDAELVVEPRVNELVSFFLASVSNLAGPGRSPKPEHQLSPTTSCADASFAHPPHFSLQGEGNIFEMDVDEEDTIGRTPSTPSSPRSVASPAVPLSPSVSFGFPLKQRLSNLHIDVAGSPDTPRTLSAMMATLVGDRSFSEDMALPGTAGAAACSFDGMSCLGQMVQLDMSMAPRFIQVSSASAPMPRTGPTLDARILRQVDKINYSSQLHIIFRDHVSCDEQLSALKLYTMKMLVLEVQSGLRHGHVPEELSMSGRDSIASQQSNGDSWEQERASWWQQHLLSQEGKVDGHLTDFDYGELVQNCCGGTYMMRNKHGNRTAIFKPIDEEPFAPSNPKGFVGLMDVESEMKAGVVVGGGAARECAAFLLDHQGLGAVPCTAMLRIAHTTLLAGNEAEVQIKVGSLQRFQQHDCTAEDVGTARFDLTQAHAIGVLDVRTFNMDRNSDNVLVQMASTSSSAVQLVPIDHGYILPSYKHLEEVHSCWLYWPQSKEAYSTTMLEYIDKLDAESDMQLLRTTLALPEDSLLTLFIGTTLIKRGAQCGLTLHETGMLMVREKSDRPSAVEEVVAAAVLLAETQCFEGDAMCHDFYSAVKLHLSELIGQLVLAHQMD